MKSYWVQTMPVISTVHMPDARAIEALEERGNRPVATYQDGGFVFLGSEQTEYPETEAWLQPISLWLRAQGFTDHWIRIDADGDEIEALPTFNW